MSNKIKFLHDTATYFRKRPTGGEDMAHWANISNAETCERIAKYIENLEDENNHLRKMLSDVADTLAYIEAYPKAITRPTIQSTYTTIKAILELSEKKD